MQGQKPGFDDSLYAARRLVHWRVSERETYSSGSYRHHGVCQCACREGRHVLDGRKTSEVRPCLRAWRNARYSVYSLFMCISVCSHTTSDRANLYCRISRSKLHGGIRSKVLERCRKSLDKDKQGIIVLKVMRF